MYAYDDTGLRITKTVNGVEHKYYYDGNLLIYEEYGDDMLIYVYDENGSPIGVKHRNKNFAAEQLETYLFGKNLQGDIIAIYNTSGTAVVKYVYDAWGNIISTSGTQATGIGAKNSLRYRGYYYDTETGLYYLQSRHYDPVTGRFISADDRLSTGGDLSGMNLYAYCGNNPVNRKDPAGQFWISAIIISAIVIVVVAKVVCSVKEVKRVQEELESLPEPSDDITENFSETLKTNANTIKDIKQNDGIIEAGKQFYYKVRNGGEWDLKQLPQYKGTYKFNGMVVQGQDIGNINFGYTGKELGLSDEALLTGAGIAQIKAGTSNFSFIMVSNGDDLRDQMFIKYGIMLYNSEH